MNFSFSKEKLLAALEARRAWAIALDKKQAAEHTAAEKKALLQFRANVKGEAKRVQQEIKQKCKAALAANYKEAKDASNYRGRFSGSVSNMHLDRGIVWPQCPKSTVQKLDQVIAWITTDGRKRYKFGPNGEMRDVHYLLTYDETLKPDVCA